MNPTLTVIKVRGRLADECSVGQDGQWFIDCPGVGSAGKCEEFYILEGAARYAGKQGRVMNLVPSGRRHRLCHVAGALLY